MISWVRRVRGSAIERTGNTIFNWGVAPRMQYGIQKDASSFKRVIVGNNVNYYAEAAVLCEGWESLVGDSVGHKEKPHQA